MNEAQLTPPISPGAATTPNSDTHPHQQPVYPSSRHDTYASAAPSSQTKALFQHSHPAILRRQNSSSIADSFVVLTESQIGPPRQNNRPNPVDPNNPHQISHEEHHTSLSNQLQRQENLFEILSARTDVDHPICVECADILLEAFKRRLASANKERDAFVQFLQDANQSVPSDSERAALEAHLSKLSTDSDAAVAELQELEKEREEVEAEIKRLEYESKELEKQEEEEWRRRNEVEGKMRSFLEERDRINLAYDGDSRVLERLKRGNVYNDTFFIGYDGHFGTINGLRLGRLQNQQVSDCG